MRKRGIGGTLGLPSIETRRKEDQERNEKGHKGTLRSRVRKTEKGGRWNEAKLERDRVDDADENDVDHAEDATCLKRDRPRNGGYGLCFRFGPPCPVPRAVHASVVVSVDAETPTYA